MRKKIQDATLVNYGFNMAINMAIGFINLGRGRFFYYFLYK